MMYIKNWKNESHNHESKRILDFLSKQNPDAKVTLTNSEAVFENDDESWYYEDNATELEPYCLTVGVLGNGDVDIRWL